MVRSPIPPLNLKCISQQRFKARRDMFTQTRLSATAANFHVTPLCCDLCSCTSHMPCPLSVCLSLSHTHTHTHTHTYTCRVKECVLIPVDRRAAGHNRQSFSDLLVEREQEVG